MKILIFGTGKYYTNNKNRLKKENHIVGFLDNDKSKQGMLLDGCHIYAPIEAKKIDFDYIVPMSVKKREMFDQLVELGIDESQIITEENDYKIYEYSEKEIFSKNYIEKKNATNVLVLSHSFSFSGAQNALVKALDILSKYDYNIVVISNKQGILQEQLSEKGIYTIWVKDLSIDSDIIKKYVDWANLLFINTLLLHFLVEDFAKFNKPIIWWLHESGKSYKFHPWGLNKIKKYNNVKVCSVSEVINEYLQNDCLIDLNIDELCFGINSYEIEKKQKREILNFLNIGPFSNIKGQDILLKAIDSLSNEYKNKMKITFVGGGEPDDECKKIIANNSNIEIFPFIENRSIPQLYENADVVICSSREESMSIAVMEGFMNGLPAIISDVTGIKQFMVDGREGFIVPTENPSALAEKIKEFVDNPELIAVMGENAKNVFYNNFTLEIFEKKLLNIVITSRE